MGTTIDECVQTLKDSRTFHMSLGSKELFHSNFLHWISIVNWDAFLNIMHELAEIERFWWEGDSFKDCNNNPYHPNNNNVKVLREHRNFDLSIYILYSEKGANGDIDKVAEDGDNSTEFTHDSEGKRKIQKWLPVLVLENKMKSLPFVEQLEGYTQKAFEEWANIIKEEVRKSPNNELTVSGNNQYSLTFILLSLKQTKLDRYEFENKKEGKRPPFTLKLESRWTHQTYKTLLEQLSKVDYSKFADLDKQILEDYCKFVKALCSLAEKWNITSPMDYCSRIFPWNIKTPDAETKRKEIDEYKELRIHDIHEKLLYNQLLQMLEGELINREIAFKRYNYKTIKDDIKKNKILTNTNYAHGVGIVEVFFVINTKIKLIIQVQGDRYCHMVISNGIVSEGKNPDGKKTLSVNTEKIPSDILKNGILDNYISINNSSPDFPLGETPSWGRYGSDNIYQFVEIPQNATIQDVIKAMVDDINKIKTGVIKF